MLTATDTPMAAGTPAAVNGDRTGWFMAFNLDRFKKAQSYDYATALEEIRAGEKQSHWMWYIFPQLEELGYSETRLV